VDVPNATPSKLVVAFGKDGNCYLLNRTNLGGISPPVASANVAVGTGTNAHIIQAAASYTTSQGTYVVFANAGIFMRSRSTPPTHQRSSICGRFTRTAWDRRS